MIARDPARRRAVLGRALTGIIMLGLVGLIVAREATVRGVPTWPWAFLQAGD